MLANIVSSNDMLTNEDYWRMFLAGDTHALDRVVKNNYSILFNYGRKFTNDEGMVEDCIQELFLTLWKNRDTIGETFSVKNYLIKSLRRRLQGELSKAGLSLAGGSEFLDLVQPSTEAHDHSEEIKSEVRERVLMALGQLSKRQQEIIYLRFYLNLNASEIAVVMGLNRQTAYNLLQKAISSLRSLGDLLLKHGPGYLYLIIALMTSF